MQLSWEVVLIEDLVPQDHLVRAVRGAEFELHLRGNTGAVQQNGPPKHRPGGAGQVHADWLPLRHPVGTPDRAAYSNGLCPALVFWPKPVGPVPDHSTISQNRRRRPAFRKVFQRLFEEVVRQCVDADHGIILDVTVTSENVSDAAPLLDQLEHIHRKVIPIQCATADAIYDFPLAHQVLGDHGINFCVRPIKHHEQTTVEINRDAFSYDEEQDRYICPNGKQLRLNTLRRSSGGLHWVYLADRCDCQACPLKESSLSECRKEGSRKLERSYFEPAVRRDLSHAAEPEYREALLLRQIWFEGTFAAQKWGTT